MENTTNILSDYIKSGNHSGVNDGIANFMLSHMDGLERMRIADIAEKCHVSSPSVIRFCRDLGYDNFKDFKDALRDEKERNRDFDIGIRVDHIFDSPDDYGNEINVWMDRVNLELRDSLKSIKLPQLRRLTEEIMESRYVYCFGNGLSRFFGDFLNTMLTIGGKGILSMSNPGGDMVFSGNREDTLMILVTQRGLLFKENPKIYQQMEQHTDKIWIITQMRPDEYEGKDTGRILFLRPHETIQTDCQALIMLAGLVGEYCNHRLGK